MQPPLLSHSFTLYHLFTLSLSLSLSLPACSPSERLVSVEPRSRRPTILIGDQTSVQSSVTTGSWELQVWRGLGESLCASPRPSSPAGQSLYMKLIGLGGIMTPAHHSFLAVWGTHTFPLVEGFLFIHKHTHNWQIYNKYKHSQRYAYTHSGTCAATCL